MGILGAIGTAVGAYFDGPTGAAIGGSIGGGIDAERGQSEANQFSAAQSAAQMQFQERMSNTAYQRAVADMKAAGLNPMLAYQQGGASTPAGAQAAVIGNKALAGLQGSQSASGVAQALASFDNTKAQTELIRAQADKVRAEIPLVEAQTGQSVASAGHVTAQADKVRQEIQAWIDVNRERAFIARDGEWQAAASKMWQQDVDRETVKARIEQAKAEAQRLSTQAKLLGLDVPRAMNEAAFETAASDAAGSKGVGVAGKVLQGAAAVKRVLGK